MKYLITLCCTLLIVSCSGNSPKAGNHGTMGSDSSPKKGQAEITVHPGQLATIKDVVCGMSMKGVAIADTSKVRGKIYTFCHEDCKKAFDADVKKYAVN